MKWKITKKCLKPPTILKSRMVIKLTHIPYRIPIPSLFYQHFLGEIPIQKPMMVGNQRDSNSHDGIDILKIINLIWVSYINSPT